MALLLFFSSSGLTLDIHFCQGEMKRLNLFGEAKTCAEVSQIVKKCHSSYASNKACVANSDHKGCCNNKSFDLDLDFDAGEVIANALTQVEMQFIKAFVFCYSLNVRPTPNLHNSSNYYPPTLKPDIAVLFQTFLL